MVRRIISASISLWFLGVAVALVDAGESGNLRPDRVTQEDILDGRASLEDIQLSGLRLFTTMFNKLDGYGDGPADPADTLSPGGRPTLQGNGTFLRVNGLDAQTCLECHSFVRTGTSPPTLGIGGVGGSNANAIIMPTQIDPTDADLGGSANFTGRYANPPFVFGAGAVELVGLEMTTELQALKQSALANPGTDVDLITKGVDFGILRANAAGSLDFSDVHGVDDDLIVRPFGRKGEFATIRDFDLGALQFHLGMQPVEVVGADVDADGDGVFNESPVGDLTALSVFIATLDRPVTDPQSAEARRGFDTFQAIGCVDCHKPSLTTLERELPLRFPEVATDPTANVFYRIDLTRAPMNFERAGRRGIRVPLFADLKRHDMGDRLAENFAQVSAKVNREFTTARLWGIADTAPYLHDGRATTLTEAILFHGGEAQTVRDRFAGLEAEHQDEVLAFLRSLRTPSDPARRVVQRARAQDRQPRNDGGKDHGPNKPKGKPHRTDENDGTKDKVRQDKVRREKDDRNKGRYRGTKHAD